MRKPTPRRERGFSVPNSQFSIYLGVALVCLFGLIAVTPLWRGSLPQTADGIIHLYRLVELDNLFRHGVLFSRWAPDLVYGLGLPLFNFYAPLSYYLAEVFHLLGLSLVNALKAVFCLAILGSGATMYLYVRDLFGETAAIVAAVAYMYAPYQLYDSFFRGILPEALVLAFFPMVMWSFRRLITLGDRRHLVIGALGVAALPLTHTTSTLILFPLLVTYAIVLLLLESSRRSGRISAGSPDYKSGESGKMHRLRFGIWGVVSALVLGLALSAFFTLPAILERRWVQIERGLIPPNLDYHHHFLSLAEILSPPRPTDTGRMNPAVPRSLGLVQTIPAIAAVTALRKRGKSQKAHILFFAFVLTASVAMTLPQSVALWDRLPPLAYLQFPFRWLGPASLAVAVLVGAFVDALSHSEASLRLVINRACAAIRGVWGLRKLGRTVSFHRSPSPSPGERAARRFRFQSRESGVEGIPLKLPGPRCTSPNHQAARPKPEAGCFRAERAPNTFQFLIAVILLTLLVLAALPMLYPGYQRSLPANPSLSEMMDMERRMGAVGTTATGEYLPIWVEWVPPESLLEPMYRAGQPLKRLDTSTWPEGCTVLEEEYTPTGGRLTVQLAKTLKVFFDIHYFPGWRAYIDGEEVPIEPTQGQGRISFIVPAGKHVIHLQFEELPLRLAADAISVISLLTLLGIIVYLAKHEHEGAKVSPRPSLSAGQAIVMAGLALLLLAVKVAYVDHHDTFFKWSFDGTRIKGVQHSLNVNFDDKITLLGYDLGSSTIKAGDTLRLDLYWKAQRRLETSYGVQARLVDSASNVYAQQDNAHPGSYPTSWWEEGKYMKDTHRLTVPKSTPPGQYLLQVGLYEPSTLQPLPVLLPGEEEVRETLTLQPLSVTKD